ncbi:MAG: kelch repeat-containing protein [Crocinitomicaceae bacterium]
MKVLLLVIFGLISFFVTAQTFGWDSNVYLPGLGRDDAVCFTVNKVVYVGTGNHSGFSESNTFYGYDTRTGNWVDVTSFPGIPRQYATVAVVGSFAYLIGGLDQNLNPSKEVWQFDPSENSWIQLDDFPAAARWQAVAFVCNDQLYYGTGRNWEYSFNDFWQFNPKNQQWKQLADVPILPRHEAVGFALYEEGYIGLGRDCTWVLQDDFWKYQPTTNSWEFETFFPAGERFYATAAAMNGWAFIGTGEDAGGVIKKDFWRYDPATEVWEEMEPLPEPARRGVAACTVPFHGIYLACGLSDSFDRLTEVSRYTYRHEQNSTIEVLYHDQEKKVYISNFPHFSTVRILNMNGQLIYEGGQETDHLSVNTSLWKKAVYIVWVNQEAVKFMVR